jgi:dipeptidyl aminopeptidase/acylaminoacyl peptidase
VRLNTAREKNLRNCRGSARREKWRGAAWLILAAGTSFASPVWGASRCAVPALRQSAAPSRLVTASDLVRLRDFGDLGTLTSENATAASPDGRTLVVQLRQGQPDTNDYCTALVVLGLGGSGAPRTISDTGNIVPSHADLDGLSGIQVGTPMTAPVVWSPDGRWIGFVKTRGDGAEIWRIRPAGNDAALLYASPVPVTALAWTREGNGLVFTSQPAIPAAKAAIAQEGMSGWHYDQRFWPMAGMAPHPLASIVPSKAQVVEVASRALRPADAGEAALVNPDAAPSRPKGATAFATSRDGRARAWAVSDHPGWFGDQPKLHASIATREVPCSGPACGDIVDVWWQGNRGTLMFLRHEGVARSRTGFYRWQPGEGAPKPLWVTDDAIFGCHQDGDNLVCAHESSLHPRSVVVINGHSGAIRTVFDPNPEWTTIRLGAVKRFTWRNSFGVETFGDLVLPVGYHAGQRVPLIIVQYESRGFLRGGTADDFPIQLYAAHGFAVLSFNRPPFPSVQDGPKSPRDFVIANQKDWVARRSIQSSLETIVGKLATLGIVDPTRVGITGQSDGASAATYGLIHSHLFAAAALSTCCEDSDMMATLGEGLANAYAAMGYPWAGQDPPGFWANSSLDLHADRTPVPILIQASEQEARLALRTYTVLKNAHWPIDMYIFPGESHVKLQSAHRLALFNRSLEWFARWLTPNGAIGTVSSQDNQPPQPVAQASMSTH